MPALAKVTVTEDAKALMVEHNALPVRRTFGGLEGASEIDLAVLHSLGAGTMSGLMLKDCTTAAECAQARQDIAIELLKLDPKLVSEYVAGADPKDKTAHRSALLALGRVVAATVAGAGRKLAADGSEEKRKDAPTMLLATTEEDCAYTDQSFDQDKCESQAALMRKCYNEFCCDHQIGLGKVLKQAAYWVNKEMCWPDPSKVGLKQMKRKDTDSASTCFMRVVYTTGLVACGKAAEESLRDDGAGAVCPSSVCSGSTSMCSWA